jgi:hypothetical protein
VSQRIESVWPHASKFVHTIRRDRGHSCHVRWIALFLLIGCSDGKPSFQDGPLGPAARNDPDPMLPGAKGGSGEACRGWECAIVDCGGAPPTILSGVVHDPGGNFPIYNALVYVPNQKETPLPSGPNCNLQCPADKPIAGALTDAQGRFHIANVPTGNKVPLVIQIGKWRRRIEVPTVKACADNPVDVDLTRLPRNRSEGSLPTIAITTGCDHLECFASSLGVDGSEITGPSGGGSIHVYRGHDDGQSLPDGAGDADALFSNSKLLQSYDIVLASSECGAFPHNTAMLAAYVQQGGGTLLASGSQAGLISGMKNLAYMATWLDASAPDSAPYSIDVTSPLAKTMSDWAKAAKLTPDGTVDLAGVGGHLGAVKNGATKLIKSATQTELASFRVSSYQVCGRATYADFEVSGRTSTEGAFPTRCNFIDDQHKTSEALFQPAFFDWTCDWQQQMMPPIPE